MVLSKKSLYPSFSPNFQVSFPKSNEFSGNVAPSRTDEKLVQMILHEVLFREDATPDQFIDAISCEMQLNLDYPLEQKFCEIPVS